MTRCASSVLLAGLMLLLGAPASRCLAGATFVMDPPQATSNAPLRIAVGFPERAPAPSELFYRVYVSEWGKNLSGVLDVSHMDRATIDIGDGLPAGAYCIIVGLWRTADGARDVRWGDKFRFTVSAPTLPVITCPGTVTTTAARCGTSAPVAFAIATTGAPAPALVCRYQSGDRFPVGITRVRAEAINSAGSAMCEFDVVVNRSTEPCIVAPTITCPGPITVTAAEGEDTAPVTFAVTATGSPDPEIELGVHSGDRLPIGLMTVTARAANAVGEATCRFDVVVQPFGTPGSVPGGITQATIAPVTVAADAGAQIATNVRIGTPAFSENCSIRSVGNNAPVGFPVGVTNVTWTIVDTSGNQTALQQPVTVIPCITVTDAGLRTFDAEPARAGRQMHLIFLPSGANPNRRRLDATNPGGFSVNAAVNGTPGAQVPVTLTAPAPFATVGSTPIRAYSGVTMAQSASGTTYVPGTLVGTYPNAIGGHAGGSVTVNVTIPTTGFAYITMQLAVSLTGTNAWVKDADGSARINEGGLVTTAWNPGVYTFASRVGGAAHGAEAIGSANTFKVNPGCAGYVRQRGDASDDALLRPVTGAVVKIATTTGTVRATAVTDADGYFAIPYCHSGAAVGMDISVSSALGVITGRWTFQRNAIIWCDTRY